MWVPLAALALVVLAACGGGGSTAAASSPDDTTRVPMAARLPTCREFLDCMKEQGVELPDGGRFQQGAGGEAPPGTFQLGQGQPARGNQVKVNRDKLASGSPPPRSTAASSRRPVRHAATSS